MREIMPVLRAPSNQQWASLFSVARRIAAVKPWRRLSPSDIIRLEIPGRAEPVFCSVMNEGSGAIAIYPDYNSFCGLIQAIQRGEGEPDYIISSRQNCVVCYFGDREDVDDEDRKVYARLGLRFESADEWIYFRAWRSGFQQWYIDASQADIFAASLEQALAAYIDYIGGNVPVDYSAGEVLNRVSREGIWSTRTATLETIPLSLNKQIVDDELFVANLHRKKRTDVVLEFDILYFPAPIQETPDAIPYFPQMAMLFDATYAHMAGQYVLNPLEDEEEEIALRFLGEYILAHGRPRLLRLRDIYTGAHVEDLCQKIGLKVDYSRGVPSINAFVDEIIKNMPYV